MHGSDVCGAMAQAFYHPYFFAPGGACPHPARPTIDSVDGVTEYGQDFTIETPDGPNVPATFPMGRNARG